MRRAARALRFVRRSACAAVLGGALVGAAGAEAASGGVGAVEGGACPQGGVVVRGASARDAADVCQGAAAAVAFLAGYGVRPTEPLVIEVAAALPAEAGPTAAGCYLEAQHRVVLVPYAAFQRSRTWFGVPIDRRMYHALAAHEAAHAIAACHFAVAKPPIQAKEYVAYVAMFGSMPRDLRESALRATATQGFDSLDRFTSVLYLFDPMRFGAEAWRHFAASADPAGVIREVLAGRGIVE